MKPFVELDGRDKYQDFWRHMKNATIENFQNDLFILNSIRKEMEDKCKKIYLEEKRLLKLMSIIANSKEDGVPHRKDAEVKRC